MSNYKILRYKEYLNEGLAEDLVGVISLNNSSSGESSADNVNLNTTPTGGSTKKELESSVEPFKVKTSISNDATKIQPNFKELPYSKLVNVKNLNEDPKIFLSALSSFSSQTGIPMANILTIFAMESGMVSSVVNSLGYTGLFQLSKKAIERYGMSIDQYRNLPGSKQLEYFKKYLDEVRFFRHDTKSLSDLYLSIFYPFALSKDNNYVLGSGVKGHTPELIAKWNPVFVNSSGVITKGDVIDYINKKMKAGYDKKYSFGKEQTLKQAA